MEHNTQINNVIKEIERLLHSNLVGIYLHGSLAMGCFNPSRSDIDLLVVTKQAISLHNKKQLTQIMLHHSNKPCPLEVSSLHISQLNPWRYPTPYDFHYGESWRDRFNESIATNDWSMFNEEENLDPDLAAHIMITNTYGLCLAGKPIAEVFPNIPKEDYVSSILYDFNDLRELIDHNPIYAVLNMCRVVLYLKEGIISSKKQAGEWALENLPRQFKAVIREALIGYACRDPLKETMKENLDRFADYMEGLVKRETERRACL